MLVRFKTSQALDNGDMFPKDNPADHLTRVIAASALACNEQWWKGPEFFQMDEEEWLQNQFEMSKDAATEQKKQGRRELFEAQKQN